MSDVADIVEVVNAIIFLITIPVALACFLMSLFTIIIQVKKDSFRKGFFKVVLTLVSFEMLTEFVLCLHNILPLCQIFFMRDLCELFWLILFCLFAFSMNTLICYNVAIVYFLQKQTTEKDPMITKDLNVSTASLTLFPHSFKSIHVYSLIVGFVTTLIFIGYFFYGSIGNYYTKISVLIAQIIILLILGISFIFCLSYYIKSKCNRYTISNKIYLTSYAFYAFIYSLFWLSYNVYCSLVFDELSIKPIDYYDYYLDFYYDFYSYSPYFHSIISFLLLFALLIKLVYRWKCYYVQTVLLTNSPFCNKLSIVFSILFCCYPPQGGTIVDHNSMFIMHSLATNNDFTDLESDVDSDIYSVFGDEFKSNKDNSFRSTNK